MKKQLLTASLITAAFVSGRITQPTVLRSIELEPQLIVPAVVTNIHDGDTLTVEIKQKVNVRMLDCWAKELKEDGGEQSLENLRKICPETSEVLLQVPIKSDITRMFTFGRILGNVYKDGKNLSEEQVKQGFATKTKIINRKQ